jgi:septal ring factor EnvC (AmiA/AmiB activator)
MTRRRDVGLILVLAAATAFAVPIPSASAARDPLADAQAKITAAQVAADNAAADYGDAETRYYQLQGDARRTERLIASLHAEVSRLAAIVRQRAIVTYMGGSRLPLDDLFGSYGDALDAARRAILVDRADASSNQAMQQLGATTDDLGARERDLRKEIAHQAKALKDLRARQDDVQRSLESARSAAQTLRAQLERERRLQEYATLVRQAQAAAHARAAAEAAKRAAADAARRASTQAPNANGGGTSTGGGAGQIVGSGSWVCPVQGAVSFTDTYGAPRSGGRTHKGVDMFAARGTPTVAVVAGSVFFQSDPLGGLAAYVNGNDGNTYYYAHLNDYVGGGRSVAAGEVVGHVGNTGDASDAPPHLHFEIRLGGPNGTRINPYPTVRDHC